MWRALLLRLRPTLGGASHAGWWHGLFRLSSTEGTAAIGVSLVTRGAKAAEGGSA